MTDFVKDNCQQLIASYLRSVFEQHGAKVGPDIVANVASNIVSERIFADLKQRLDSKTSIELLAIADAAQTLITTGLQHDERPQQTEKHNGTGETHVLPGIASATNKRTDRDTTQDTKNVDSRRPKKRRTKRRSKAAHVETST